MILFIDVYTLSFTSASVVHKSFSVGYRTMKVAGLETSWRSHTVPGVAFVP